MSRLGFNDCGALVVGLSLRKRIRSFFVENFLGPARVFNIDGVFVVDKTSNDIEDLALLPTVEDLRERGLRHAAHFNPSRHLT